MDEKRKEKIEQAFAKALKEGTKKLEKQMRKVRKELDKAIAISEKYGIPFMADISPVIQPYNPDSFPSKFRPEDLSEEGDDDHEFCHYMNELLTDNQINDLMHSRGNWYVEDEWVDSDFC